MNSNQISILMATFNGESYIRSQIASIQDQSFKNWQLLISDDGSSDDTVNIIRDIALGDSRIKVVNVAYGRNKYGAGLNFLNLLKFVNSEFICFCDQDDIWFDNKLELLYNEIMKYSSIIPILIYSQGYHYSILNNKMVNGITNLKTPKNITDLLFMNGGIQGCSMIFNKKLVYFALKYMPKNIVMHDHYISMVAFSFGNVYKLKLPLMLYRHHANNVTFSSSGGILPKLINHLKNHSYLIDLDYYYSAFDFLNKIDNIIDEKIRCSYYLYLSFINMNIFLCVYKALRHNIKFADSNLIFIFKIIFFRRFRKQYTHD